MEEGSGQHHFKCVCFMYINLCTHRWQHLLVPSRAVHPTSATGIGKKKKSQVLHGYIFPPMYLDSADMNSSH